MKQRPAGILMSHDWGDIRLRFIAALESPRGECDLDLTMLRLFDMFCGGKARSAAVVLEQ